MLEVLEISQCGRCKRYISVGGVRDISVWEVEDISQCCRGKRYISVGGVRDISVLEV